MRRLLALLVLAAAPLLCAAQSTPALEGGARAVALGHAATALEDDVWGLSNPASWSTLDGRALSLYAAQAFGLEELRLASLAYAEPLSFGTPAVTLRTFGFDTYRETDVRVGFSRGFSFGTSRAFHAAAVLGYYHRTIEGYGSADALGLSLGALVRVAPRVTAGAHALNVNAPELAGEDEIPRSYRFGLGYDAVPDRLRLLADVYKDVRFPVSFRGGVEVYPVDVLALRAGFGSQPSRLTLGAGFRVGRARGAVAAERHEVLGWSPAIQLGMAW